MARLPRTLQKIFAGDATANPNVGQFGSLAAGSPTYTKDLNAIQALSRYMQGWASATIDDQSPALEDMNALCYLFASQLAYGFQQGIPEWIVTETYYTGQFSASTAGVIYRSKTDGNIGNALSDTNNWENYVQAITPPASTCKAWVCFEGTGTIGVNCTIFSSYGVASVLKEDTGQYLITFSTTQANANYAFTGSCGTPDGQVAGLGDDNIICGGKAGDVAVKTTTQFRIYAWDAVGPNVQDSKSISVQVFGL